MAHSKSLSHTGGWDWPEPKSCPAELIHVISSLNQSREYILRAVRCVDYTALWHRPVPSVISMGNILMHLRGTEHHWIGFKVGNRPLNRNRDAEMSTLQGAPLAELLTAQRMTEQETNSVIAGLDAVNDTILFCFYYTENHFSFHAGQLVTLRKLTDPGFTLYN